MNLFHINPKTGNPGKCSAADGNCPFGSAETHFTSAEAARAAFEADHSSFAVPTTDISQALPQWHGKIPAALEKKIAKQWADDEVFVNAVNSGSIETKYSSIEQFLSPPVYAQRDRGTWFEKSSEDELNDGEYLIVLHTRQGGGNRECYCETGDDSHEPGCLAANNEELESHPQYFRDEDDDFDSTYANFYFRGGFSEKDKEKAQKQRELLAKAQNIAAAHKEIEDGVKPPWSLLAKDSTAYSEYQKAKREFDYAQKNLISKQANAALANDSLNLLTNKKELTAKEAEPIALLAGYKSFNSYRFLTDIKNYRDSSEKLNKAQALFSQAEALPAGELKDYLIGDRGTGSYNTTEKVGRRNVTVRKEFARGSMLGSELKDANRVHDSNKKAVKEPFEKLKEVADEAKTIASAVAAAKKPLEEAREKAWLEGWSGPASAAPPVSDKF